MSAVLQSFPANEVGNLLEFIDLFSLFWVSDKDIEILLTQNTWKEVNQAKIILERVLEKVKRIWEAKRKKISVVWWKEEEFKGEQILEVWNSIKSKTPDHKVKELLQWSKRCSFLPQTLDAWLIWSGNFGTCLDELQKLSLSKTHWDQAEFAKKFIRIILPKLRANPNYLMKSWWKRGLPRDIYGVYQKLGEWWVQVINYISSQIQTRARNEEWEVGSTLSTSPVRNTPKNWEAMYTHTRELFPDPNHHAFGVRAMLATPNHAELRQRIATYTVWITDQKIARWFQLLRGNLSRRGISWKEISVWSLITNGFWSLIYSAIFTSTEFYRQHKELLDQILREINASLE